MARSLTDLQASSGYDAPARLTSRRRRARAAAAALAAGGLASLSVVLLGAPASAVGQGPTVVVAQPAAGDTVPTRRADVTLGER